MNKKIVSAISIMWFTILLVIISGCSNSSNPSTPPISLFKIPAIGTLIPGTHEESIHPTFAPNTGGVLFVNQSGVETQIGVSSTIVAIPAGANFLFILPPNTYRFYIYPAGAASWAYTETSPAGSMRYVYLPLGGVPGSNK